MASGIQIPAYELQEFGVVVRTLPEVDNLEIYVDIELSAGGTKTHQPIKPMLTKNEELTERAAGKSPRRMEERCIGRAFG